MSQRTKAIHVIRENIPVNNRDKTVLPVSIIHLGDGQRIDCHEVKVVDKDGNVVCKLVYAPDAPVMENTGHLYLETDLDVVPVYFNDTRANSSDQEFSYEKVEGAKV